MNSSLIFFLLLISSNLEIEYANWQNRNTGANVTIHALMDVDCPYCSKQRIVLNKLAMNKEVNWVLWFIPDSDKEENTHKLMANLYCIGELYGTEHYFTLSEKLLSTPKQLLENSNYTHALLFSSPPIDRLEVEACLSKKHADKYFKRAQHLVEAFDLKGTPGLLIQPSSDASNSMLQGYTNYETLLKRIKKSL